MRFLVDECTGPSVARWLQGKQHDVLSVFDEDRGAADDSVLRRAVAEDRIIITTDKDFGEMVFRERKSHRGIVLLRLNNERAANKIAVLEKLLDHYADRLSERFVAATESAVRIVE